MKMDIEWHEDGLRHSLVYEDVERAKLKRMQEALGRLEERNAFYAKQIEEAKRRGLTRFDPDRFMIPKRRKAAIGAGI